MASLPAINVSHHSYIVLPFAHVSRCQILIFLFPAADGARRGTWHPGCAPTSLRRASDPRAQRGWPGPRTGLAHTGFIQTKGRFIQPRRLARQMRMRLGVFVRVPDDEAPPEYCSRRENVRASGRANMPSSWYWFQPAVCI